MIFVFLNGFYEIKTFKGKDFSFFNLCYRLPESNSKVWFFAVRRQPGESVVFLKKKLPKRSKESFFLVIYKE